VTRAFAAFAAACLVVPAASAASFVRAPLDAPAGLVAAPPAVTAAVRPAALPPSLVPLSAPTAAAPAALAAPELAPPALPVPAAAPALAARAPAAMDGAPESGEGAKASAPGSGEAESVAAGARFDGAAAPRREKIELGAGLRVADPAHAAWLAELNEALARSKTGRRVLRDIARLERTRGNPTLVVVKPIGNNGEFRYDSDLLVMDAAHLKRPAEQTAPIFAHELQHVLQRALGLPADALELEVESYTVENRVWSELGVRPARGSFALMARRRLLKDADGFLVWLSEQYKDNRVLHGETTESYAGWLRKKRTGVGRRIARAEKELEKARRVAAAMRAEGKPEAAVRSFVQDDVEPVERRIRDSLVEKNWIERDLGILSTAEGRRRFRAYSRGVIRRARALSRS
jgi:hypothetical protein